jgi:hypothetical protein
MQCSFTRAHRQSDMSKWTERRTDSEPARTLTTRSIWRIISLGAILLYFSKISRACGVISVSSSLYHGADLSPGFELSAILIYLTWLASTQRAKWKAVAPESVYEASDQEGCWLCKSQDAASIISRKARPIT